jgi:hypothetical protein
VACADANEAATLAAACSLPSEVFTAGDLISLASQLTGHRCGMRADHRIEAFFVRADTERAPRRSVKPSKNKLDFGWSRGRGKPTTR